MNCEHDGDVPCLKLLRHFWAGSAVTGRVTVRTNFCVGACHGTGALYPRSARFCGSRRCPKSAHAYWPGADHDCGHIIAVAGCSCADPGRSCAEARCQSAPACGAAECRSTCLHVSHWKGRNCDLQTRTVLGILGLNT